MREESFFKKRNDNNNNNNNNNRVGWGKESLKESETKLFPLIHTSSLPPVPLTPFLFYS